MGYSMMEIEDAQARYSLRFPPDLVRLLEQRRPLIEGALDWIHSDRKVIQQAIDWPFEGFWFDVQNAGFWRDTWGEKPRDERDQKAKLLEVFADAPKLIPLHGHRYIPDEPHVAGNPVISVYQTDLIYYGSNLAQWINHEQFGHGITPPTRQIRFWSDYAG